MAATHTYAQSQIPKNLPTPPPIPPEILNSQPKSPPPDLPQPQELFKQLRQLDELLRMSPDQLKRIRQTIEFVERMTPDEREAMLIRLSQITQMTPELQQEIDRISASFDSPFHSDFSQFWLSSTSEKRSAMRQQLAKLSPTQSKIYLQNLVDEFVQKRDAAFENLQKKLELKKQAAAGTPPSK